MSYLKTARDVLEMEANALKLAGDRLSEDKISDLCEMFHFLGNVGGNLVFSGVGKSGHIAQKLASTFSSLGLPSWFLHPTEALHGDLGRIKEGDSIVFISKSGTTEELLKVMPFINIAKDKMIALVGNPNSSIAERCGLVFDCSVEHEACINDMAPTTSSTLALAMGDAMAVVYEKMVGLSKERFAINHPGGILGKSLCLKVSDLMCHASSCPAVASDLRLKDVLLEMTRTRVGGCAICKDNGELEGIIVEGDIRRVLLDDENGLGAVVANIMNESPVTVGPNDLAYHALTLMEKRKREIDLLPVVDESNRYLGFVRLHDLLKEGFSIK